MADRVMANIFSLILQMLHPYIPFLTEELWNTYYPEDSSILQSVLGNKSLLLQWKEKQCFSKEQCKIMESLGDTVINTGKIISLIRFFQKVFLCKNLGIFVEPMKLDQLPSFPVENLMEHQVFIITAVTGTQWIKKPGGIIQYRDSEGNLWILSGVTLESSLKEREITKLRNKILKLKKDLDNPEFLSHAHGDLIQEYKNDLFSTNIMLDCILQCT